MENGPNARWNDFFKESFKIQNDSSSKLLLAMFQMWFEMRATEDEKRIIWRKIQDAKDKGKTLNISEFGKSHELSWKNLYSEKDV